MSAHRENWLAAAVLAAWAAHALSKLHSALLSEMLWACHVASLAIGVGLALRLRWLVAVGTLFHLAVGVPAYTLDLWLTFSTTPTSLVVHALPPVAGWLYLRTEPWPRHTPLAALSAYAALVLLCRWLTEPVLNINLAFAPYAPLRAWLGAPWMAWLLNGALLVGALGLANFLLERRLAPRSIRA